MAARDGLILKFSTDLLPAQKSIQDFALNAVSMLSSVGRKAAESQMALEAYSRVASTAFLAGGALVGLLALNEAFKAAEAGARAAAEELGKLVKIGTDAKGLGVDTTFFQQFTEGSKKLGLEAEDLTKILEKLKDASMVSLGSGDDEKNPQSAAQKAIQAEIQAGNLHKGDDKSFSAADSQQDRLRASLALISELQAKGAQLASFDLGNKLFGSDFESKLRGDDQLVAKLQQRLADMSNGKGANVVPPEQIAAAREMQAQLEDMNQRIQNALIPFHNDLRAWQQSELADTIRLKEYWTEIVEVFGRLWKWCDNIGATISSWGNASFFRDFNSMMGKLGLDSTPKEFIKPDGSIMSVTEARRAGVDKTTEPDSTDRPLTITRPRHDTSRPLPETDSPSHDKADKTDPVDTYIDELKKSAAAEEAEAKTLGMNDKAKMEAVDLAKAQAIAQKEGRSLTEAETTSIKQQADAFAAAKVKIDQFNKSQEDAKARAEFFGNALESSVEKLAIGGGKLKDIFASLVKSLEEAALKAAILGQGPLAGLFGTSSGGANGEGKGFGGLGGIVGLGGSLFGGGAIAGATAGPAAGLSALTGLGKLFSGFFAEGGAIPSGGWGVVGEAGPEIIRGPGTVTPQGAIDRMMGSMSSGGSTQVTHAPTYNIMPAGGVSIEQMTATIDKNNRDFSRNINAIVANGQRRY